MAVFANDWIGISINVDGVFEKDLLDHFTEFLAPLQNEYPKWDVLDIGANIGNHAIYFAKLFGRVLAFEPNPSTFKLLEFNSAYAANIEIYNYGLGETATTVDLHEDPENFGGSSTIYHRDKASSVKIDVKNLVQLDLPLDNLSLMKIDVEGMEIEVLKGGLATVERHMPIILLEQLPEEFTSSNSETESIKFLRSLGYKFCWVQESVNRMPWIFRKFKNVYQLFFGKTTKWEIVTNSYVPKGMYKMIMAVPERFQKSLSL